ncbi:hypothetical protein MUP65_02935, partial [Patescibacteria group bacterium]|nr:hypothetical protein [Patescibacteria group bacterium]
RVSIVTAKHVAQNFINYGTTPAYWQPNGQPPFHPNQPVAATLHPERDLAMINFPRLPNVNEQITPLPFQNHYQLPAGIKNLATMAIGYPMGLVAPSLTQAETANPELRPEESLLAFVDQFSITPLNEKGAPKTITPGLMLGRGGSGAPIVISGPEGQPLAIGNYIRANEGIGQGTWVCLDLEPLLRP